ncbi:hypothetical protein AUJ84_00345 [Candidatus Pacearchaeota archaeon CG1_02_32_132]|nr:MAG: hypothetical protein AUJ84_00345 [Candidatus Pacearchaeota archaeon CG1_02_32_132]
MQEHIKHLKKHRNALYGLIVLLLILQILSFFVMTGHTSKIIAQQEKSNNYFENKINGEARDIRQELRFNVEELSKVVSQQSKDIRQEINLLKSSQEDFSGIVEEAIKGVVSVTTDTSAGSGFFVDSGGYVVTNMHVIANAQYIKIVDYNGNEINAEFLGGDETNDLALLKVPGVYNHLELVKRDSVLIGEKVIAIGNPLGLSFSVTEGIVSALKRAGPNGLNEYIQTDVTLNPGNSGGPLINKEGKVIGINNFKIGGAESLGFALESDVIRENINRIANVTLIN